jgi:hypothetical protein
MSATKMLVERNEAAICHSKTAARRGRSLPDRVRTVRRIRRIYTRGDMDSSMDGGLGFLHSWSDDLDPAARRSVPGAGAVIDLDGVYLPTGDAPALAARSRGDARAVALSALTVAATWLLLRAP